MSIFINPAVPSNGIVHCACNQTYCSTDQVDVRAHARHHAEFIRVTRNKGHVPSGHDVCEQLKDAARKVLRCAASVSDFYVAANTFIRAYFDRSFQRAIERGLGDLHPDLPSYARTVAEDGALDPRVNAALLATYGDASRASGRIDGTLWEPPSCARASATC